MSKPILEVENISKLYHLGKIGATTLRETAEHLWYRMRGKEIPVRQSRRKTIVQKIEPDNPQAGPEPNSFWSLKNVSFSVQPGEIVGIIGRNGAGKSTLLKILSRITEPTSGRAILRGRVASLLEVGTGFHPELTGRENIYLNGTILGMRKHEIDRKFDEIVAFAEMDKFIDTPVKHYSSGMHVRLGFAVAAHLEPEILFVDEVLAVGDFVFQKKCLGKMEDVAKKGRTVLLVSHNMAALASISEKALVMKSGKGTFFGPIREGIDQYLGRAKSYAAETFFSKPTGANMPIRFRRVALQNEKGELAETHLLSAPIQIAIEYEVNTSIERAQVVCHIWNLQRVHILSTADIDCQPQFRKTRQPGVYKVEICLPASLLAPGSYQIEVICGIPNQGIFDSQEGPVFEVSAMDSYAVHWSGGRKDVVVGLPLPWKIEGPSL